MDGKNLDWVKLENLLESFFVQSFHAPPQSQLSFNFEYFVIIFFSLLIHTETFILVSFTMLTNLFNNLLMFHKHLHFIDVE